MYTITTMGGFKDLQIERERLIESINATWVEWQEKHKKFNSYFNACCADKEY